MPETMVVAAVERPALGFALQRAVSFYGRGTAEQREVAASLAQMLAGLEATPPGAVEMEFLTQDAFLLGIRMFYTSVELEEYWLDARERLEGRETEPPDPELEQAVGHFFPELLEDPAKWDFEPVRGIFSDLEAKLDRLVTALAPRARGMYNHDREEMSDKAVELREENARRRAAALSPVAAEPAAVAAPAAPSASQPAAAESAPPPEFVQPGWGVEFSTGLSPDDIPLTSFRVLNVGSVKVIISNYGGQLAAVDGMCSHQHAALAKGHVEGTTVECPRHGATFDLRTGKEICPPFCPKWMDRHGVVGKLLAAATPDKKGGDLPRYPLRVENGEIVLRV
jgi:nitrite reductase/ring-hydroxylating ferredoxin subunit